MHGYSKYDYVNTVIAHMTDDFMYDIQLNVR